MLYSSNGLWPIALLLFTKRSVVWCAALWDPFVLEIQGAMRTRINRKVGKHVHTMPTLTSMVDHHPMIQLSQVGLVELEK